MLHASCCCQAVKFELSDPPKTLGTCHCSRCRKLGSTPLVFTNPAKLNITAGKRCIETYPAEPPYLYDRCFCSKCGTALGNILTDQPLMFIPANCFDDPIPLQNSFHEFMCEKPDWLSIGDDAPRFDRHPGSVA